MNLAQNTITPVWTNEPLVVYWIDKAGIPSPPSETSGFLVMTKFLAPPHYTSKIMGSNLIIIHILMVFIYTFENNGFNTG